MLLALPVLILLTVKSPKAWEERRTQIADPDYVVNRLNHRLGRGKTPLTGEAREKLTELLKKETTRSEHAWFEDPTDTPDSRRRRINNLLDEWNSRILAGAKTTLDAAQYKEFQRVQDESRDNAFRNMTQVSVPWSRVEPFYHWLVNFYFYLMLPLMCVRAGGPLIRDELQADTLCFLITRPVGRAQLIIVKFLTQLLWTESVMAIELLLIFAAGAAQHVENLGTLLPLALLAQILAVPAFCGLGLLLGQLTTRYMATALLYGAVVEMGIGRIPTNINTISLLKHVDTLLSHNDALQNIFNWAAGGTATAVVVLVLAPALFVGVAAALFTFREYHHAAEMQK